MKKICDNKPEELNPEETGKVGNWKINLDQNTETRETVSFPPLLLKADDVNNFNFKKLIWW